MHVGATDWSRDVSGAAVKRGTPDHPKTRQLARALGIPLAQAVGHLEMLWQWTAKFAPRGDVGRFGDQAIAEGCAWPGEPAVFIAAMTAEDSRWLDVDDVNRLLVHDWPQHAEDSVHRVLARAGERFANGDVPRLGGLSGEEKTKATAIFIDTGPRRGHDGATTGDIRPPIVAPAVAVAVALPEPLPGPEPTNAAADAAPVLEGPLPGRQEALRVLEAAGKDLRAMSKRRKPGLDLPETRAGVDDHARIMGRKPDYGAGKLALFARLVREGRSRDEWCRVLEAIQARAVPAAAFARDGDGRRPGPGPGLSWALRPGPDGGFDRILLQLEEREADPSAGSLALVPRPHGPPSKAELLDRKIAKLIGGPA